jgi:hypothetical protein
MGCAGRHSQRGTFKQLDWARLPLCGQGIAPNGLPFWRILPNATFLAHAAPAFWRLASAGLATTSMRSGSASSRNGKPEIVRSSARISSSDAAGKFELIGWALNKSGDFF